MMKPTRKPVTLKAKPGVTVLGVDPGWAKMGAATLYQKARGEPIVPTSVSFCKTAPQTKKQKHLRVNVDDTRRLREVWDWVTGLMLQHEPYAVGVEAYSPGRPVQGGKQGTGNFAWKASMSYALVQAAAWAYGVPLFVFIPQDVKRAFHLKGSTSKADVAETMRQRWPVLPGLIDKRAKEQHEHLYDAVGIAYLAMEELYGMRALMGV